MVEGVGFHAEYEHGTCNRGNTPTSLDRLKEYAETLPNEEAFTDEKRRFTWPDVWRMTRSLKYQLWRHGLAHGGIVFVQVPNSAMAIVIRFALKQAGLTGALLPMQWRSEEIAAAVARVKPAAVVLDANFKGVDLIGAWGAVGDVLRHTKLFTLGAGTAAGLPRIEDLLKDPCVGQEIHASRGGFHADEVSWLLCSSGSTGTPKLLQWTETAQMLSAEVGAEDMALTQADVVGIYAPLSGYAGVYASLWSMACPVRTVLVTDFNAEHLLSVIQSERISVLSTVPPVLVRMLSSDLVKHYDLSSLRVVRVGTANFSAALRRKAENKLGCPILAAAGSMETGVYAQCRLTDDSRTRLSDTVGRPPWSSRCLVVDGAGSEVATGEVGELVVRSTIGACGYYGDVQGTELAWNRPGRLGWYHTSDLATISPDGTITLLGRKNDVINRGGNKVLPLEIEAAILRHPKVLDCAVVGVSDPTMGEVPCAWVVAQNPEDRVAPADLCAFLGEMGLATYKVPAHIMLLGELPLLGNGKVDRRRLRADFDAKGVAAEKRDSCA